MSKQQKTISRRVVREPDKGSPGHAGVGVAYDSGVMDGERFRIEQLWPNGDVDAVYLHDDDALELAKAIIEHYQFEVSER